MSPSSAGIGGPRLGGGMEFLGPRERLSKLRVLRGSKDSRPFGARVRLSKEAKAKGVAKKRLMYVIPYIKLSVPPVYGHPFGFFPFSVPDARDSWLKDFHGCNAHQCLYPWMVVPHPRNKGPSQGFLTIGRVTGSTSACVPLAFLPLPFPFSTHQLEIFCCAQAEEVSGVEVQFAVRPLLSPPGARETLCRARIARAA